MKMWRKYGVPICVNIRKNMAPSYHSGMLAAIARWHQRHSVSAIKNSACIAKLGIVMAAAHQRGKKLAIAKRHSAAVSMGS
jgi:hypothetical protein